MINNEEKNKNYEVEAYVLLKAKFNQSTKDVYQLARIVDELCSNAINDARYKSDLFKNWFDEAIDIDINIIENSKNID